ncbi:MAG: glutathione S-transferase family protein [Sneathiella sp.]
MMKLFDNAFSPFARKVRLVLDHKGLDYETVDGLNRSNAEELEHANDRAEVPALIDDGFTVINSSHIVSYLEHAYGQNSVYPEDPKTRAQALAWERCSDTIIDAILVDISYWTWADRPDTMPDGLLNKAQQDLSQIYDALESALADNDFICGAISIADLALFPQLSAIFTLKVPIDKERHQKLSLWMRRMKTLPICEADVMRLQKYLTTIADQDVERTKIFWRGDRIEWLLASGHHKWFMKEIEEGRVNWPGLGIPNN